MISIRIYKLYVFKFRKSFADEIQNDIVGLVFSENDLFSKKTSKQISDLHLKFKGDEAKTKVFINTLIDFSKNLDGEIKKVLEYVFLRCDLLEYTEKLLNKGSWVEKAITIQVVSQLNLKPAFGLINKFTDYKNELVRQEAQIAAVRLGGESCLDFVDDLKTNLSVWQQLRILEELKKLEFPIVPSYKVWLNAKNESVVIFGLKLMAFFSHFNALDYLPPLFETDSLVIKKQILSSLRKLQIPFFNDDILKWKNDDELRLEVIKTLTVTNDENQNELLEFLTTNDHDLFLATTKFFKKNDSTQLDKLISDPTLDLEKIEVLNHINDPRI